MTAWIGALEAVDDKLLRAVIHRRRRRLDRVMGAVTRLGDPAPVIVLGLLAGLEAAFTVAGAFFLAQLLKRAIGRPRPSLGPDAAMIPAPDQFSFPSGHAAVALALALPVASALPPMLGVPVLLLAAIVGVSRCYLGVHYPGDVVMGWLLAIVSYPAAVWGANLFG